MKSTFPMDGPYPHGARSGPRRYLRMPRWLLRGIIGALGLAVLAALAVLLFADTLLNSVVREKLNAALNSPAMRGEIGCIRHDFPHNRFSVAYVRLRIPGAGGDTLAVQLDSVALGGVDWLRAWRCGALHVQAVGIANLACRLHPRAVQAAGADSTGNNADTAAQSRPARALGARLLDALPENLRSLRVDSLLLRSGSCSRPARIAESTARDSIAGLSLLVRHIRLDSTTRNAAGVLDMCRSLALDARGIRLYPPGSDYRLDIAALHVSSAAQTLRLDSLHCGPRMNDSAFFARRTWRDDRFLCAIDSMRCHGLDLAAALAGEAYNADSIVAGGVVFDVLTDKRLPVDSTAAAPAMPQEILCATERPVRIGSVALRGGSLHYREHHPFNSVPGVLRFTELDARLAPLRSAACLPGLADTLLLKASAALMGRGRIRLDLAMPLGSPAFSFRYSGSLDAMPLAPLNDFLERSDRISIRSGSVQRADFDIIVQQGRARGTVYALYRDLSIRTLDRKSGSGAGLWNGIRSFITNTFVIKGENLQNEAGLSDFGRVSYTRREGDTFFGYLWFALRGGLGDVVGF